MLSLKQLKYFDAVARLKHFGRAADYCGVTQPALSMQIKELEASLGVMLIERRPKGVFLTRAGEEVAKRANRIIGEVRDLAEFGRLQGSRLAGSLKLGVIPSIAPYLLPPILPAVRRDYPALSLSISETLTDRLIENLIEGKLDLIVIALPEDNTQLDYCPLFEDRFLLAYPSDWVLGPSLHATPDMLERDRLLLLEEGHCLREQALSFCELQGVGKINTLGASSLSTLVQMVASGLGMTLLPEISLPVEALSDKIKLLSFPPPEPKRTVGLAWRASSPQIDDFHAIGELIVSNRPGLAERMAAKADREEREHKH